MCHSSSLDTCSRALLAVLCAGLAACGDGLVGADYQGLPLLSMAGQVMVEEELPAFDGEVRVAVFWSSQGDRGAQQQASVTTDFPAQYTLTLYTPPPDEVLYALEPVPDQAAIGMPLIYEDIDDNGRFDEGTELVIGGAEDILVFYFPQDVEIEGPDHPDDTGPEPPDDDRGEPYEGTLEAGYHVMETLDEPCRGGHLAAAPIDAEQVDLVVGDVYELLQDVDCREGHEEWGEL